MLEPRRRLRWWLMSYVGAYGVVVMAGEIYLLGERPPVWLDLLNAGAIGATLLATLLFFVQLRPAAMDTLFAPTPTPTLRTRLDLPKSFPKQVPRGKVMTNRCWRASGT